MQIELARIHESTNQGCLYITHYIPEAVFSWPIGWSFCRTGPAGIKDVIPIELPRPRRERVKIDPAYVGIP